MSWSVRVYAADAWVSLAPKFAAERPVIVDHIEAVLKDPVPAVRLQAAQNLQVISKAAPDRMWSIGEEIAVSETNERVLTAYLSRSLRRFSHAEPERCERIITIVKDRLGEFAGEEGERARLQQCLGSWAAQLHAGQGRPLLRAWLGEWAADPEQFQDALNAYTSSLRATFFGRYAPKAKAGENESCDRAQEGLEAILRRALEVSSKAYEILASEAPEEEKQAAGKKYRAAEHVIHHAMNQLYFGAGAGAEDEEDGPGLNKAEDKARFLTDYADILGLLQQSREPAALHKLIELYEHLIPGDPVAVFTGIHSILMGRGAEQNYHFEILGSTAVVKVVKRYIADHRGIFEDSARRAMLVEILQLFSEVGWTDSLKLLYDLPDLLR
jgi:hypothetical protein